MKQGRTDEAPGQNNSAGTWNKKIWQGVAAVFLVAIPIMVPLVLIYIGPWIAVEPWLERARRGHGEWVTTARIPGGQILDARNYLTGLRQLGPVPHLTDLTGAKLHISQVSYVPPASDRPAAIHAGYAGQLRCRVSLWITRTEQSGTSPLVHHGGEPSFSWYVDGLRYVLVTSDMQKARFRLIAKVAREATLARWDPNESMRTLLGLSAGISRPCKN